MIEKIPHIVFNPGSEENFGFEIVPIENIASKKEAQGHNPEKPHQLKFYNFIFYTSGRGRHYVDFKWYPVEKNTLVYLTKDQINAFEFSNELKGYCLIFTEAYFVSCFPNITEDFVFRLFNSQLFSPILKIPDNSEFEMYFRLLQSEYGKENSFNQRNVVNSLFIILLSKAESIRKTRSSDIKDTSKTRCFHRFTLLIEKHYKKTRSASFYAKELAITYKHLNSICKDLAHKTAKNVIDDFVILQAKRRLINARIKSTDLAYELGFEDPTNFTKYFKKNTSFTPNSFIKSLEK